jgi:mRNA interferase MazF
LSEELLLVPFPFTDLSATKRRPVLPLTGPDGYGDFIALPVTSRAQTQHGVRLTSADLLEGALPMQSWIRTDRIVTLNASLVVKSVGRVSARIVAAAVKGFCTRISFPGP